MYAGSINRPNLLCSRISWKAGRDVANQEAMSVTPSNPRTTAKRSRYPNGLGRRLAALTSIGPSSAGGANMREKVKAARSQWPPMMHTYRIVARSCAEREERRSVTRREWTIQ